MLFQFKDKKYASKFLELLSEDLPDMLWVKDIEGRYLFANKAIKENLLMVKEGEDIAGRDDLFFAMRERMTQPDNSQWHTFGELCADSDKIVIQENRPMRFEEYGNIKGEMTYLEVHKAPFHDENGVVLGTVGAGRDITLLKETQHQLEEFRDTIDNIQRFIHAGTWTFDLDSGEFEWSDEMYKIHNVSKDDFNPSLRNLSKFLSAKESYLLLKRALKAIKLEKTFEVEYSIHQDDGTLKHLLIRGKAIKDKNDRPYKILGASLDVTKQFELKEMIQNQKEAYEHLATHDNLTKLPNRTLFFDRLEQAIHRANRYDYKLVVLFLDLDNFKSINDTYGHQAGDEVLIEMTRRMNTVARESDTIARLGGDEFALILEDVHDKSVTIERIKEGMKIMHEPFDIATASLHIEFSVGASIYPQDATNSKKLLHYADVAMYRAKSLGKGGFCFYDELIEGC